MICPRCRRETAPARLCAACGAPLALGEDPPPRRLDQTLGDTGPVAVDASVALDRRARSRAPEQGATATSGAPHPGPLPAWRGEGERHPTSTATSPTTPTSIAVTIETPASTSIPPRPTVTLRRPAPWRRAAAWAIDGLPFAAFGFWLAGALARPGPTSAASVEGLLDLVVRDGGIVLSVAVFVALAAAVYATLAHGLAGATLGKWLLRLRVAGPGGARPTLGRCALRSLAALLSLAALGLGFLAALFSRSGRALHDVLAGTWVVEAP